MADNDSDSKKSSKQMPEGMRVVRKRRKKRGNSRQTLFLKKREILRDMHDEEGGAVSLKEQVARLKSAKKSEEAGRPVEERWGGPKRKERGLAWLLLRVMAILLPVLAIVTAFFLMKRENGSTTRYDTKLNFNISEKEQEFEPVGPQAWFIKNPDLAYEESLGILNRLNESAADALPDKVFRQPDFALTEIAKRGLGWDSNFITIDPTKFNWSIAKTEEVGFLVVEGVRVDHSTFRSYFVKTDEGVRLDWGASTAWSQVPLDDLHSTDLDGNVLVRCVLTKEPHFDTLRGPESLRSWYLLTIPGSDNQVWAFAPAGTPLDEALLNLFGFGRLVLERRPSVRAILRISRPEFVTKKNQFLIEEVVTEEWVLP